MNKLVFVVFAAAVGFAACAKEPGSAGASSPVASPRPVTTGEVVASHVDGQDDFDKAGHIAADGARYTWNAAKQAWEWVTSDANKQRASNAWDATKRVAGKTVDAASAAVTEFKNDKK